MGSDAIQLEHQTNDWQGYHSARTLFPHWSDINGQVFFSSLLAVVKSKLEYSLNSFLPETFLAASSPFDPKMWNWSFWEQCTQIIMGLKLRIIANSQKNFFPLPPTPRPAWEETHVRTQVHMHTHTESQNVQWMSMGPQAYGKEFDNESPGTFAQYKHWLSLAQILVMRIMGCTAYPG